MADSRVTADDTAIYVFARDNEELVVHTLGERVMDELIPALPVYQAGPGRPLPGERWSLPGRLKGSAAIDYGEADGHVQATISLDHVFRFTRKRRHAIRDVLEPALASAMARGVP